MLLLIVSSGKFGTARGNRPAWRLPSRPCGLMTQRRHEETGTGTPADARPLIQKYYTGSGRGWSLHLCCLNISTVCGAGLGWFGESGSRVQLQWLHLQVRMRPCRPTTASSFLSTRSGRPSFDTPDPRATVYTRLLFEMIGPRSAIWLSFMRWRSSDQCPWPDGPVTIKLDAPAREGGSLRPGTASMHLWRRWRR
jgi:hypothetical protein